MITIIMAFKPKWIEKIFITKEKKIEIRLTIPHAGMPFKVLAYESKGRLVTVKKAGRMRRDYEGSGEIVGEFVVRTFYSNFNNSIAAGSCLSDEELTAYGKGKAYGFEISDQIYYPDFAFLRHLDEFNLQRPPQSWQYVPEESLFNIEEYFDAHSCRAEADASGVCQVCGAMVYMSPAYCDAHGCDPPETLDDSDIYNDEY